MHLHIFLLAECRFTQCSGCTVRRLAANEYELEGDIHLRGNTLLFQKDRFDRDKNLDDEFKAILQGESARQGKSNRQP
jgi:hypothetical protein